jgi:ADP-ribosylglycohydrolase
MNLSQADLKIEHAQCLDEGKDLSPLDHEFAALDLPDLQTDPKLQARAGKLLDKTLRLPVAKTYPFNEPSDLARIVRARKDRPKLPNIPLDRQAMLAKAYGAWLGRCCGCMLGKPVEGRRRAQIQAYLQAQSRWPLGDYFSAAADDAIRQANQFPTPDNPCFAENITAMVEDDDTNYTTVGLAIVEQHGGGFSPANVADFWLGNIPLYHLCTAERVAYRNLSNLIPAPGMDGKVAGRFSSATFRNPYREWIGAQIRADFFGYCCPGDPQKAAGLAWRDASISHVKNGIYGEMWVAAMLASAYLCDDVPAVIRAGLGEVPHASRFHKDIQTVLNWRQAGMSYEEAVNAIHKQWDEASSHHWCHTNSNAQIVAAALLWGDKDFGKTICYAVMPGFDTDCNGATAGSVLGMILGRSGIPAKWADPLQDTLLTGVHGYHKVKLADVADKTVQIIEKLRPQ